MLRAWLPSVRTAVASSSRVSTASFHTVQALRASASSQTKKANQRRTEQRKRETALNEPHVVYGTRPGDDAKWDNCDLAKCIVTEEGLTDVALVEVDMKGEHLAYDVPRTMAYGVEPEKETLFRRLPSASVEANLNAVADREVLLPEQLEELYENARNRELRKADMLARIVDIRNANARGIAFENRRRIVEMFSEPGKPGDTGRTEVQVAIMTMEIRNLWSHLTKHKRDLSNRVSLRKLIHRRSKMLQYLKKTNRGRYEALLPRIGVEREAVEGELVV